MKRLFEKLFFTKKRTQIEFCQKNLDRHLNEETTLAFNEFLQHPQIQYKEYKCLSKCSSCQKSAYAIVNGQFIEANHMNDLLQHLTSEIRSTKKEKAAPK